MAAQFKSNVRLREEKGFGSVSMKRLIFCGVGAVLAFMVLRMTPLSGVSLPALVGGFVLLLVLTGARGGLPLWLRLYLGARGLLLLAATKRPNGPVGQLATALNLEPDAARLDGARLYRAMSGDTLEADLVEWALYTDLNEAERAGGLRFLPEVEVGDG